MIAVLTVILLLVILLNPAHAYVDPGAGSMMTQLILGGGVAGIVLFRSFAQRFGRWLSRTMGRMSLRVM